jgi:long-chain acyl-CoA synthetase
MRLFGTADPEGPALVDVSSGETLSFRELRGMGRDLSAHLGGSKELLFLLCRNDAFTAIAYSGALAAGHAVALLDAQSDDRVGLAPVEVYRPAWLAGPTGLGDRLVGHGLSVERILPVFGGELVRTAYQSPALHPDLAAMLATSGTTGSRKFVRLSARNLESNARSIAEYLALTPDERPITSLPLHYSFGLSVVNSHWLAGAPVVLTATSVMEKRFWDAFRTYDCTSLAGVPYTYQMLERIGFRTMDLPSLRILQQAGGALDRRLAQTYGDFMAGRGGRFFVMYGQTEATARIAYVPPERLAEKPGSVGIAIPGGQLRIDEQGFDRTLGHPTGEVIYEGPNVMMGYASDPQDLVCGDELGGVLRTGDIGYLDDDGFMTLVGRSKRIAKVFGLRVNLDELEGQMRERGPVAVVGGEDVIWVFCAFGTDDSVSGLAQQMGQEFKLHHSALRFRRVAAIPTTTSGKIDYQQVERWMTS